MKRTLKDPQIWQAIEDLAANLTPGRTILAQTVVYIMKKTGMKEEMLIDKFVEAFRRRARHWEADQEKARQKEIARLIAESVREQEDEIPWPPTKPPREPWAEEQQRRIDYGLNQDDEEVDDENEDENEDQGDDEDAYEELDRVKLSE